MDTNDLLSIIEGQEKNRENELFTYLYPNIRIDQASGNSYAGEGAVIGYSEIKDTAEVNELLRIEQVKKVFPPNLVWGWNCKPIRNYKTGEITNTLELYALRTENDGQACLDGDCIVNAVHDYDRNGENLVSMSMDDKGTQTWKRITSDNIDRTIAMVIDGKVFSAPRVLDEIPNGRSQISGDFTEEEAEDLATILKSKPLPCKLVLVEETIHKEE